VSDTGHLRRNVTILLFAGSVVEPYLNTGRYAVLLLGMSMGSIAIANLLSAAFGTQWVLAGASGGIFGLWAYLGMKNRAMILDASGIRDSVEAVFVLSGLLTLLFVPVYDVYATGVLNVSHAVGVLLGYAIALFEAPPHVELWVKKRIGEGGS
jgi:membrane associated rhomboid family serine protease